MHNLSLNNSSNFQSLMPFRDELSVGLRVEQKMAEPLNSPANWETLSKIKPIKEKIFSDLDKKSLLNLCLTSKLDKTNVQATIVDFINSGKISLKDLELNFIELGNFIGKENCKKIWNLNFNFASNQETLPDNVNFSKIFPNIANLTIDIEDLVFEENVSLENFSKIEKINILNCKGIKKLSLGNTFQNIKEINIQNCQSLKNFSVTGVSVGKIEIRECGFLLAAEINVEKLEKFEIFDCERFHNLKLNKKIEDFNIFNFASMLKILEVNNISYKDDSNIVRIIPMKSFDKELDIDKFENFLKECKKLIKLNITNSKIPDLNLFKNCPTIKELELKDCQFEDLDSKTLFEKGVKDIKVILGLPGLQKIKVDLPF